MKAVLDTIPDGLGADPLSQEEKMRHSPLCKEAGETALLRVQGRIYQITAGALRSYLKEYGFCHAAPCDYEECLGHIEGELEVALATRPQAVGTRGRILQYDSPSLAFKLIGSRIVGIRISLKYASS